MLDRLGADMDAKNMQGKKNKKKKKKEIMDDGKYGYRLGQCAGWWFWMIDLGMIEGWDWDW